jgi:hypothetical protein
VFGDAVIARYDMKHAQKTAGSRVGDWLLDCRTEMGSGRAGEGPGAPACTKVVPHC